MSLPQSAERAALNKLIDYLDDNPQENIDKIMDLVNKLVPNRVFPVQREAFTNVIKSRGNWYDLIMRVFSLNPQMRTKLLKTLIVDANLLAWPEQEKNREKYQCNVPWAILLDPTSACNLHCTSSKNRAAYSKTAINAVLHGKRSEMKRSSLEAHLRGCSALPSKQFY